jgi:phospholipase C
VLCDRWFSSLPGPTWINRVFAHAGSSLGHVNEPGSLFSAKFHLFGERTLYDELSHAGIDWRIYFGDVPQSLALSHQFRHLAHYRRFPHFAEDVTAGKLASYVFIEPTYFGPGQNDQHPPHDVLLGDALIAEVYNTLRGNPALFARTLLIVLYDEHGGFYDHVVPPVTIPPDEHTTQFGFDRLGFRVPTVLVSPMLDPGVASTVFDHTSLLRMAANLFLGVHPLGRRAEVANDPLQSVTWRATPRTDLPQAIIPPDIAAAVREPVLAAFKASLFGLTHHLESRITSTAHRTALMLRAHEALEDSWAQAKLATDRLEAWLRHGGPHWGEADSLLQRVGGAIDNLRQKVGL